MNKTLVRTASIALAFSAPAMAQDGYFCGAHTACDPVVQFPQTITGNENVCFGNYCPNPPSVVDVACWRTLDPDLSSLYTAKQITYCKKRKEGEDDLRRAQHIAASRPRAEADRKILDETMKETSKP